MILPKILRKVNHPRTRARNFAVVTYGHRESLPWLSLLTGYCCILSKRETRVLFFFFSSVASLLFAPLPRASSRWLSRYLICGTQTRRVILRNLQNKGNALKIDLYNIFSFSLKHILLNIHIYI